MQLTIEEQERQAYAAGDTPLATAWGRIIDLENQACEYRALIREAVDYIRETEHADHILRGLHRIGQDGGA